MKTLFATTSVIIAMGLCSQSPAVGQTPDGMPPANEGVCDVLIGSTPGLYGLCVAFCEAQDHATLSEPITEDELQALTDAAPSGRLLENYNRRKRAGDPDMPCIKVEEPCPCWDSAQFDQATLSGAPLLSCTRWNGPVHNGARVRFDNRFAPRFFSELLALDHQHRFGNYGDNASCQLRILDQSAGINIFQSMRITPDELRACDGQIRQRIEELSLICGDSP